LKKIDILLMPPCHPWETIEVFFEAANGRSEEFEVDPETGLTVVQIAHLCAIL
jgi:hypothetical protein